jgi:DNA modification methylase
MTEANGDKQGFSDTWESFDEYIQWYANIVNLSWSKLKPHGWMYLHNNFIGNALVLSQIDPKIRDAFYTNISWKRSGPKNNIKNGWGNIVDSILVLKRGNPYFEVEYTDLDAKYERNSFKNKDDKGFYALAKTTGEKSRVGRLFEFKGYSPVFGWRVSEDMLIELDEQNLLHFGKSTVYKKIYLEDNKGVPIQNFWDDIHFISRSETNKRKYPTQKPLKLLERIIRSSCPSDGWVLDPFAGSGTTALAAQVLGRNCVTCDVNPAALEIAKASLQV